MGRIVFGAILVVLFALFCAIGAVIPFEQTIEAAAGSAFAFVMLEVLLLLPGVLLIHFGRRARRRARGLADPSGGWIAVALGAGFLIGNAVILKELIAGRVGLKTDVLVLIAGMPIFLGAVLMAMAFVVPRRERLGAAKANLYGLGLPIVLTIAATWGEVAIHNYHRDALVRTLAAGNAAAREQAARNLAESGYSRGATALIQALRDPSAEVRQNAARALGHMGDRSAVPALIAALDDASSSVQLAAIGALSDLHDPAAVAPLGRVVDRVDRVARLQSLSDQARSDAPPEVRASAMKELILLDTGVTEQDAVRPAAAAALAKMPMDLAAPALVRARDRHDLVVVAAAHPFFLRHGQSADEMILIDALRAHGTKEMAEALLNCGNPRLSSAAKDWASQNGYKITTPFRTPETIRWGGK